MVYNLQKTRKGFTLIEGLLLVFIISVVVLSVYQVSTVGISYILDSKNRLVAISVANQQMEKIRNLPYSDVGILDGNPSGSIDSTESVDIGTRTYNVETFIFYNDDPQDGLAGSGDDIPNDYKIVQIDVSWGQSSLQSVSIISQFVPETLETASGGGVLSINIVDVLGQSVSGASVNVYNSSLSETFDSTQISDSSGNVTLVGLEESSQSYEITITDSSYDGVQTFSPYPTSSFYPANIHVSVLDDNLTTLALVVGELSSFDLSTVSPLDEVVEDVDFNLRGGQVLGTETGGETVYNFDQSLQTDSSGVFSVTGVSPGEYIFSLTEAGYRLWKIDYGSINAPDRFFLPQGSSLVADVVLLDETVPSIFVFVTDGEDGLPLEGVTVDIENTILSFSDSTFTDQYGYAYFPLSSDNLLIDAETYAIDVDFTGYDSSSDDVTVDGLTDVSIELIPSS